jgi:hypothetical protein
MANGLLSDEMVDLGDRSIVVAGQLPEQIANAPATGIIIGSDEVDLEPVARAQLYAFAGGEPLGERKEARARWVRTSPKTFTILYRREPMTCSRNLDGHGPGR